MESPIVFIIRHRIKEGCLEEFRVHYHRSIQPTLVNKPGTLIQLAYENEDSTEVSIVRLFPDVDALDLQLQGAEQRTQKTYEFVEPVSMEIYGTPNPATLDKMKKIAGSGIEIILAPNYLDGFIRQAAPE